MKDEKMVEKMIEGIKSMGIEEKLINEYMIWGVKKMMIAVMKLKWSLEENDIRGEKADKIIGKIYEHFMKMDADEIDKMLGVCDWKNGKCCNQ